MPCSIRVRVWPRGAPAAVLVLDGGRLLGIEKTAPADVHVLDPALPESVSGAQATTAQHEFARFLGRAFGPTSSLFRSPPLFGRSLDQMIASRAKGTKTLDLGCGGPDRVDGSVRNNVAKVGLDIWPLPLNATIPTYSRVEADGTFPFPDEEFDVVRGLFVLEHVTDLRAFIHETSRVLRRGGLLAVVTTHCPVHSAPRAVGLALGHLRDFSSVQREEAAWLVTLADLRRMLTAADLEVGSVFGSRLVQPDGALLWCGKPREGQPSVAEQLWIFATKGDPI